MQKEELVCFNEVQYTLQIYMQSALKNKQFVYTALEEIPVKMMTSDIRFPHNI